MSLVRIPSDVTKKISACSDINSFKKAVEELVYNAFDAKSTSIAVRVFIQASSIQVIDNGYGISHQDLKFLGCRYMTSKFKNGSEEELIQNYGYRGLSLARIIDVSHNVKITSRCSDTENTFSKTFVKGKDQDILKTSKRPSKGTTVDISGFLYNLHIQKNAIDPLTEIAQIKSFLEQISLVHCNTSISLRDDSKHEIIFKIFKHRDINQTLLSLFEIESKDVQELIVEKNEYKIHGFIEKTIEENKKYHYIYINGRFINISRLHDTINKKLRSNDSNRITKTNKENFKGEKVTSKNIPFYFIFIKCPQSDYDINHTSEHSIIEFKNWDKIAKLVDKLVKFYNGDHKVRKLTSKNDLEEKNKDTRKQVEQIMHKILGNNSKKSYGLQLKTGIKGKNVKRKQKNKAHEMSISKIVSKQLKFQLNKFNKKHICESNNGFVQKDIIADSSANNINCLSIRNKTIAQNETEYSQNKQDISQENVRKIRRISQDPLNIKFKNPTDTVLRRFNTISDQLKHFIPIRKKYVANKVSSHAKYITNYTMQKESNFVIKPEYISELSDIKTSYDLVKSIFRENKLFEIDLASKSGKNKQSKTKSYFDTDYTIRKRYKHKLSYESHSYSEAAPAKKERKFISNSSCNNFKIQEPKVSKSLINKKNKRRKYFIDKNYSRQGHKSNRDYLYTDLIQSTLHTIETMESHYGKEVRKSNNFQDKSYYSHRLTYQTLDSNLQQTYNSKDFCSSNIRTGCNVHTTYTIDISDNKNDYRGDKGFETHEEIISDSVYYKNAKIVFVSESNSKNLSLVNPLLVCETVYQSTENLDNSKLSVNNIKEYNFNCNNITEISQYFTDKEKISPDYAIHSNKYTLVTNNTSGNVSIIKEDNKKSPFLKENIETDIHIETNKEGFKLNSRSSFIPKGMSQITKIPLPKTTSYRDLEENYYENTIYENFATNVQIFSEVLEPGVQNLNDIAIKGSKPNNDSMDPVFDTTSLKEAKVLGQVDLKFIAAKVIGKYSKTNIRSEFLVLFDQHAVDERIRLENNLSDYFDGEKWSDIILDLHLKLSKECLTYLHNYKDKFTRFGLDWSFKEHVVCIKSIPKAILGKNLRQIDVIMKAVKSLIYEQIESIKSLKGNVSLHPKSIMNLVSSEACRYAIKFGDTLTKGECQDLLRALSTCKLPFQCAHGRPAMAVMMELPVVNYDYKVNMDKIKKFNLKKK